MSASATVVAARQIASRACSGSVLRARVPVASAIASTSCAWRVASASARLRSPMSCMKACSETSSP